jgi:hypothetical protein
MDPENLIVTENPYMYSAITFFSTVSSKVVSKRIASKYNMYPESFK